MAEPIRRKLMMNLFIKITFSLIMSISTLYASEEVPTQEEVAKLYVATFNRAPDAAGLYYWVNDSNLTLSKIAQSFFDQPETQALYPSGTSNRDFIQSVYGNLFNREPDTGGWDYWENELDIGSFSKNSFIQAVINGALDSNDGLDATILNNKTEVGLYFANVGLTDIDFAKSIMENITSSASTVDNAIQQIDNKNGNTLPSIKVYFADSMSSENSTIQPYLSWYFSSEDDKTTLNNIYNSKGKLIFINKLNNTASAKQFWLFVEE